MAKIRPDVYIKVFNVISPLGFVSPKNFEEFKDSFNRMRDVHYDKYNDDYYFDSFRTVNKEIKRAAFNAGLKGEAIKASYEIDEDNIVTIEGHNLYRMNMVVYVVPDRELKLFKIAKVDVFEFFDFNNPSIRKIKIDEEIKDMNGEVNFYSDSVGMEED